MAFQEVHCGIPRLMWESDHEWLARKAFIDSNKQYYSEDRLGSLSMAWSNWKFMGCSYSMEVQALLEDCHARVPSKVDEDINILREKAAKTIKFVKSQADQLGTRIGPPNKGGKRPLANDEICPPPPNHKISKTIDNELLIPGFTLYLPSNDNDTELSHICILNESAQKCKMNLEFIENYFEAEFSYEVYINHKYIATGKAPTKKEAKRVCAEQAVNILRQVQPVDHKKNHEHLTTIEKSQLVKSSYLHAEKIPMENVGNKLLRKMGWSGAGGVGKFEHGRMEPVFVDEAEGRRGVGHEFEHRSIKKSPVEQMLLSFLSDQDRATMKFSSDLSKDDRKLIHRSCEKYHLKHKSYGVGNNRYLVISK